MNKKALLLQQLRELEEEERKQQESPSPPVKPTLSRQELAAYLEIDLSTLQKHGLQEKIPHLKVGNRRIYRRDVVDWYMLRNTMESITDPRLAEEYRKAFLEVGE